MNKIAILLAVGIMTLGGVVVFQSASIGIAAEKPKQGAGYVTLDVSLDQLENDFNAAAGKTRLVFIVGPSCGPCLRGLDDMNRVLGDLTRDDPNLKAFVVYVPTLGAKEQHAARAVRLMKGADIHHYWDPGGQSGVQLQHALGIDAYAWDVWLVYDGDAVWSEAGPPAPVYWEHQLGGLPRENHLDPKRFAAEVEAILRDGKR